AEDGIRDFYVTGVQTCALPISAKIDVSGNLKPAVGHGVRILPAKTVVAAADYRPAPKVLDAAPERNVREAASAAVGLRLSIAERSEERRVGKEWRDGRGMDSRI